MLYIKFNDMADLKNKKDALANIVSATDSDAVLIDNTQMDLPM
jgi:hypothetical protein